MSTATEVSNPFSAAVRRGDLLSADCPSREVLKHMTSRWGVLVLVMLLGGIHRFSELRRKIGGVSEKMLSQTLQGLEFDGLIDRKSLPVVPPHVEYSLTPLGQEAAQHLEAMVDWIEENLPKIMSRRREVGNFAPRNPG
ncbi:helix-turn-helix transcriptional regulator [Pseudomonas sp. PDM29]|uniref:winged helix-turn-helix transcriptional regulator n=1 Tax=unclassified Pseudomonas TaxID=196821 RepID=UPI001C4528CD|nr:MULTISPECIES: helix-turn-helix domain-containing protein [unclassified Pseudomonas]MBV7524669.1 helix-turn-helix transcriptional regulator [Pseudomonas sp. PDM29]